MNQIEMEELLTEKGFTAREIAILRRLSEREGVSYHTLLRELKGRFLAACFLLLLMLIGLVLTLLFEDDDARFGYIVAMLVSFPILYFFIPMKLGFKAFKFKRIQRLSMDGKA